ncbi:ion transporter [Atopomonas sediminilitoris]|uniref:ion transporter n=1 Tax=Atopomonas sediminilitoris TaxID=2919919 RepID=UPI001F4E2556|nr:ion transporter [Atopomonas sediminilitoris]MCJ8168322.1 ion transporter [Atopomonas sediminilitoris]
MTTLRRRVYFYLEDTQSWLPRLLQLAIALLILGNVAAVVLESVAHIEAAYAAQFLLFEQISVALFSLEYLLRLYSAPENPSFAEARSPRMAYLTSPMAIVDLLAIAPFFLAMFISVDTRILRVLRLLRVFKLARYSASLELLGTVMRKEASSFASALFVMLIIIIFAASGMYAVERHIQPEHFGSIPAAMWWATVTLTTVGYGDVVPHTALGKAFGMVITLAGVGMAALPAGILASGFSRELELRRERFTDHVQEALADGVLSGDEREALDEAAEELGIPDEDAQALLRRATAQPAKQCPHCGGHV